ncbi:hypothetical protein DFH27DRAFT_551972 [Peziza echinospora]|nr:hypothetical protein DFH27DRAFT_551972 [Peziza echinospora]
MAPHPYHLFFFCFPVTCNIFLASREYRCLYMVNYFTFFLCAMAPSISSYFVFF